MKRTFAAALSRCSMAIVKSETSVACLGTRKLYHTLPDLTLYNTYGYPSHLQFYEIIFSRPFSSRYFVIMTTASSTLVFSLWMWISAFSGAS